MTPMEAKNARGEALLNSRPFSHWMDWMVWPNCMETKAKNLDKLGKVNDLTRKMRTIIKDNQIVLAPKNTDN
jgi:hypothetical protein